MQKFIFVFILILFANYYGTCQVDKSHQDTISISSVDHYYFPTKNSDFFYFFLRKDARLKEGLIGAEVDYIKGRMNSKTRLFIPIINTEKWNYAIPIYYDRFEFASMDEDNPFSQTFQNLFSQSVLNYYPNKKLTFSSIIETRFRGNGDNLFGSAKGNMIAHYFVVKYKILDKISIAPAYLIGHQWNEENEMVNLFSFELKWNPTPNLAIMAGLPGLLGVEWSAPDNYDFVFHMMPDNGVISFNAALRKRFNKKLDLTLRFNKNGYKDIYSPTTNINIGSQEHLFNQTGQIEESILAELTLRPTSKLQFLIKAGYNLSSQFHISKDNTDLVQLNGNSGFYFGGGVYWRFKK